MRLYKNALGLLLAISFLSNVSFTYLIKWDYSSEEDDNPFVVGTRSIHHSWQSSPVSDILDVHTTTAIDIDTKDEVDEAICSNDRWCSHSPISGQENELCVPMRKWQTSSYPTGNIIHEIDMIPRPSDDSIKFLGSGSERIAWKVGGIVLKTMVPDINYDNRTAEVLRYDSMVMEQRTASPHIINIYGMTAASQLLELAPGGEITSDMVRKLSPQKKLEYAIDIAQAVADIHGSDNTLVHGDMWIGQFLFSADGKLKASDFNQGFFQRWNKVQNIPCPMRRENHLKASKQISAKVMKKPLEQLSGMPMSEKLDIYGIGVMLYYLLTTCKPYECDHVHRVGQDKLTLDKIIELKHADIPPALPLEIANSTIPEIALIRLVVNLALRRDPEKRPSAQSIVSILKET
jgi:serine/threonine protein kinase